RGRQVQAPRADPLGPRNHRPRRDRRRGREVRAWVALALVACADPPPAIAPTPRPTTTATPTPTATTTATATATPDAGAPDPCVFSDFELVELPTCKARVTAPRGTTADLDLKIVAPGPRVTQGASVVLELRVTD